MDWLAIADIAEFWRNPVKYVSTIKMWGSVWDLADIHFAIAKTHDNKWGE